MSADFIGVINTYRGSYILSGSYRLTHLRRPAVLRRSLAYKPRRLQCGLILLIIAGGQQVKAPIIDSGSNNYGYTLLPSFTMLPAIALNAGTDIIAAEYAKKPSGGETVYYSNWTEDSQGTRTEACNGRCRYNCSRSKQLSEVAGVDIVRNYRFMVTPQTNHPSKHSICPDGGTIGQAY